MPQTAVENALVSSGAVTTMTSEHRRNEQERQRSPEDRADRAHG